MFPTHGLTNDNVLFKSTKAVMEVNKETADLECQYRSRQFFKQKY